MHIGFQAVRLLGLQPDDRVAQPLRRAGRDGLLARREKAALHPQPADNLLRLRSEVAAMLQGLLHHDTDVEIEANITDTHGASIVGFGFCELLGFKLMPRFKQIGRIPLYAPGLPTDDDWAAIAPVISARPINWGSDRPAVRRVGQVRDRAEARHRRSPTAPSRVYARRAQAPRSSGDGRARPRRPHDLPLRLPRR